MIHNFDLTPLTDASYEGVTIANAMIAFPHGEARGEITKLINGENYVHNAGYYHHDRVATITGRVTVAQAEKLVDFLKDEVTLYFSDELATYSCFVQSLDVANGALNMTLKIIGILMAFADIVYPPAPVPPIPVEIWYDKTDNSFWSGFLIAWNGTQWASSDPNNATLGWLLDSAVYHPTKMRITYTGSAITYIGFYGSNIGGGGSSLLDSIGAYTSLQEILLGGSVVGAINFYGFDFISSLAIRSSGVPTQIQKIEFYEDAIETPTTMTDMSDDTFWPYAHYDVSTRFYWTGSAWQPANGYNSILFCSSDDYTTPTGLNPAFVGYRPKWMRITFTPSTVGGKIGDINILDQDKNVLLRIGSTEVSSGAFITLSNIPWGTDRIIFAIETEAFDCDPDWLITVTKIEFSE